VIIAAIGEYTVVEGTVQAGEDGPTAEFVEAFVEDDMALVTWLASFPDNDGEPPPMTVHVKDTIDVVAPDGTPEAIPAVQVIVPAVFCAP
jgi:hypothetical protein